MTSKNRNYRASFILDNRGKEETVDQIVEGVKKIITEVKGEVTAIDTVGKRDFIRVTDKRMTSGNYVQINFAGPAEAPAQLREKLRLNDSVYRTFIQSV